MTTNDANINWSRIARAVERYTSLGFKYIETPWHVDKDAAMITCPSESFLVNTDRVWQKPNLRQAPQSLVGSAEQGFLQLAQNGQLNGVNYISAGPCFREEPVYDELHHPQFFKVEMFVLCKDDSEAQWVSKELLYKAKIFMQEEAGTSVSIVDEGHGWDLELNGIELGSYGYRCADGVGWWAYGTGVAEPRFSQALHGI